MDIQISRDHSTQVCLCISFSVWRKGNHRMYNLIHWLYLLRNFFSFSPGESFRGWACQPLVLLALPSPREDTKMLHTSILPLFLWSENENYQGIDSEGVSLIIKVPLLGRSASLFPGQSGTIRSSPNSLNTATMICLGKSPGQTPQELLISSSKLYAFLFPRLAWVSWDPPLTGDKTRRMLVYLSCPPNYSRLLRGRRKKENNREEANKHICITPQRFRKRRIIFWVWLSLWSTCHYSQRHAALQKRAQTQTVSFHFPLHYTSNNQSISNRKPIDHSCVPGRKRNASVSLAGKEGRLPQMQSIWTGWLGRANCLLCWDVSWTPTHVTITNHLRHLCPGAQMLALNLMLMCMVNCKYMVMHCFIHYMICNLV